MRTNKHGCPEPPLTPEEAVQRALEEQRDLLLQQMTSPVLEIEQPQQGRTQFRSVAEMQRQMAIINGISGAPATGSVTVIRMAGSACSSGCGCPASWNRWGDTL